jgi:GT2 family glycosyltransferase
MLSLCRVNDVRGSVIIASWNAADVLERCLESVDRQELPGGFETIVVDNASTDGTAEILRGRADRVRIISNDENVGFSAANNRAAREASGDILFFLNSDTELLAPDTLARLADTVEEPGVGIAGPMLLNPDGTLQPSCAGHPGILRALLVGSGLQRLLPDRILARVAPQFWSHDRSLDTDWLMGAALAVRADVFRALGGFWPTMYGEDEDLAYRAQRHGMRVRFESSARVMHVGNQGNSQRWTEPERAARVAKAELVFLGSHVSWPRAATIRAIVSAGYVLRVVAHFLLRRRTTVRVFWAMVKVYARGERRAAV